MSANICITKIISGGQTGADRAGLDWAIANSVPHGGWCPKGREAEDGLVPPIYHLWEPPDCGYLVRTEYNVRYGDATVIFTVSCRLGRGSLRTRQFAAKHNRPCLQLSQVRDGAAAPILLRAFLQQHPCKTLTIAGSRASREPGVGGFVQQTLSLAFAQ